MKLLIVDDHSIVREGLSALLRQAEPEADVMHADSAAQAAAAVEAHADLDVVFLDLVLGDDDGLSVIPALTRIRADLPLIILSSSEDPADVRRALALGAMGYIPKSANPRTLLSALKLVLSGSIYLPPLMLDEPAPASEPRRNDGLTGRQVDVLKALCRGLSNKEIARELDLAEKTVKAHVTAVFRTLGVVNRTQASNAARAAGFVI